MQRIRPASPEFMSWPFDEISRLHEQGTVAEEPTGLKVFLGYNAVKTILTDNSFLADEHNDWLARLSSRRDNELAALVRTVRAFLIYLNPPVHTRIRSVLGKLFTRNLVDDNRHVIESMATEALKNLSQQDSFDLIEEYAGLVPSHFIAHLMGVPSEDVDRVKAMSDQMIKVIYAGGVPYSTLLKLNMTAVDFEEYFLELIRQRRQHPGDDLISRLLQARDAGELIDDSEVVSVCLFLFVAGQETTIKSVGNAAILLLKHPDQLARLTDNQQLIKLAANEFLRFAPPLVMLKRVATRNLKLSGADIAAGESVLACITAANHDPTVFSNPGVMDISRREASHLAFGSGVHTCVGAYLATLELQILINTLLHTLPGYRLAGHGSVEWGKDVVTYGPTRLMLKRGTR